MLVLSKFLTDNVEVAESGLGLGRVDLAHVGALVGPLDVPDVKVPGSMALVGNGNPWVPCNNVALHGQDGRLVIVDPSNLI